MNNQQKLSALFVISTVAMVLAIVAGFMSQGGRNLSGLAIGIGEAPEGFASPYDPYDNNAPLMTVTITPQNSDSFSATIDVTHQESAGSPAYVYKKGYYLSKGAWQEYSFPETPVGDSNWIVEHGRATVQEEYKDYVINSNEEEFVVAAYSCKLYDDDWKCGCRAIGDCGYWMLQSADLGDPVTGQRLELSPRSISTTIDGNEVNIDVNLFDGEDIYGFDFSIEYDPTVLSFAGLTDKGYLGQSENEDYLCVDYSVEEGRVRNIACTSTGTTLHQGSGTLKTLHFDKVGTGYAQVRISENEVATWSDVAVEGSEPAVSSWAVNNGAVSIS